MTTIYTWLAHSLYTRLKRELTTISAGLAQNQKPTAKAWIDHDFCGISTLVCERTAKMWIDYDHLMIIVLYHFKSWQIVNFPFISNNFSAVPAYHNSYVILGIVPSILIFWNEFCCLHKSYLNKPTLNPAWSQLCKHSTDELVGCYEIFISQVAMDLFPLTWMFSFVYHRQDVY